MFRSVPHHTKKENIQKNGLQLRKFPLVNSIPAKEMIICCSPILGAAVDYDGFIGYYIL